MVTGYTSCCIERDSTCICACRVTCVLCLLSSCLLSREICCLPKNNRCEMNNRMSQDVTEETVQRQNQAFLVKCANVGRDVVVKIYGTIIMRAGDNTSGLTFDGVLRFITDKRTAATVGFFLSVVISYFLIPLECDMPRGILNGLMQCTDDDFNTSIGTNCSIKCNERYRIKGKNSIECLKFGNWTPSPTCELITCPEIADIDYGSMACTDGNNADSKCTFTCDEDHRKFGPDEAICQRNGQWSISSPPTCILRKCEPPPQISFGKVPLECSNSTYKVGTTCKIACTNNHVLRFNGADLTEDFSIECLPDEKWSATTLPSCVCPRCKTGDNCQWTTSWMVVRGNINQYGGRSKLNYAGHDIETETSQGFHRWKHEWRCWCRDKTIGYGVKCAAKGRFGSCEHACSQLIRNKVASAEYEEPCDMSSMIEGC